MFPQSLNGTLFRVGPSSLSLDGDGRVDKIVFRQGRISQVASRVIETPQLKGEYRSAFGANTHVSLRKLKNPANTALVFHAGTLLALWEGGHATAIDPETLDYIGPHTFGGCAKVAPPLSLNGAVDAMLGIGGDAVCAHTRVRDNGRLVMLLSQFSLTNTRLRFVEFESDSWQIHSSVEYHSDGHTHCHDFFLTENGYVFYEPKLNVDIQKFRRHSILDCVDVTGIHKVSLRKDGTYTKQAIQGTWFPTHIADKDHVFGIDNLRKWKSFNLRDSTGTVVDQRLGEFPAPAPTGFIYAGSITHLMDSWIYGTKAFTSPQDHYHLEPLVVGEYVLGFVITPDGNQLVCVELESMQEVARVGLQGINFFGLHSIWVN